MIDLNPLWQWLINTANTTIGGSTVTIGMLFGFIAVLYLISEWVGK